MANGNGFGNGFARAWEFLRIVFATVILILWVISAVITFARGEEPKFSTYGPVMAVITFLYAPTIIDRGRRRHEEDQRNGGPRSPRRRPR
jgi:hypothetical protein